MRFARRPRWSPVVIQFRATAATASSAYSQHCSRQAGDIRPCLTRPLPQNAWPADNNHATQKLLCSQSPLPTKSCGNKWLMTRVAAVAINKPVTQLVASASIMRLPWLPALAYCFLRFSTKKIKLVAMHTQPSRPPTTTPASSVQTRASLAAVKVHKNAPRKTRNASICAPASAS